MRPRIQPIKERIQPIRESIVNHALFQEIKTMEDIQLFIQHHVYAGWNFMSLRKSLQRNLTCVETPWFPSGAPETRFLINDNAEAWMNMVNDRNRTLHTYDHENAEIVINNILKNHIFAFENFYSKMKTYL